MPSQDGRTTENEIAEEILRYLVKKPGGEASMAEINRHLTYRFPFTQADKEPSPSRGNEVVWEQQVRNIVSHRDAEGNYIREGFLEARPGGLAITDAGATRVGNS